MAAATAAIEVLGAEPGRVTRLQENVKIFVEELAAHGVKAESASAIVPILVGDEKAALAASAALETQGILVPAIRYPTVARGTARLRVALMSAHEPDQLCRAASAVASCLASARSENGEG